MPVASPKLAQDRHCLWLVLQEAQDEWHFWSFETGLIKNSRISLQAVFRLSWIAVRLWETNAPCPLRNERVSHSEELASSNRLRRRSETSPSSWMHVRNTLLFCRPIPLDLASVSSSRCRAWCPRSVRLGRSPLWSRSCSSLNFWQIDVVREEYFNSCDGIKRGAEGVRLSRAPAQVNRVMLNHSWLTKR